MESAWPEVETAAREGRREVKLAGSEVARRVAANGLPNAMFDLPLNLLTIADTQLERLPDRVGDMRTLRSLLAFNNQLIEFPKGALALKELSVLDLSRNRLSFVPQEVAHLTNLTALNLNGNAIGSFPGCSLPKLATLDLSHNELVAFPDMCRPENAHLADFRLNANKITEIPAEVSVLPSLKNFDLADNQIKFVPKELSEIPRLKGSISVPILFGILPAFA